ncbi:hypothetical protein NUW58_g7967 [Xylaria curta]|uniref:Uncharacterized protein n=1 Tax=Xylaria curta TaxID=42375 RepID=A0ACC1NCA8_9PEZI|nr:hypothetical protein NUW58_g7967 [Xylaria curta]
MVPRTKYALVTGCGQGGIGEALVKEYALHGFHPIATLLPSEPDNHLTEAGITVFRLDVTENDSVHELKRQVVELTGGFLEILVNNAGLCKPILYQNANTMVANLSLGYTMTAIDTDVSEAERMFNVNILGPIRMVREFHECIVGSSGTIVNIGSVGGIVPYIYGSSYNATKAALHHWSNTLRVELSPLGVKVLTVISGNIGTNILKVDQNAKRELPSNTTDRFEYAARVVAQSSRTSPPAWFWYGKTTLLVRFLDTFAWRTDMLMWHMFSFRKLNKFHTRQQMKKRQMGNSEVI